MKWALIYFIGTGGTFETGFPFDNYLHCMETTNQASEYMGAVEYLAENEESLSHQASGDEIKQFLEDVEDIEDARQEPRFWVWSGARKQRQVMDHNLRSTAIEYWEHTGTSHPTGGLYVTALYLPTK
ncbi:MAG TPA: hypothetical protein DHW07_05175 [Gammaproteobacteria bacterium]|nr:hypothetical protein [Gammaproteobacteria bacterium]|tara:strand:- start:382 stop:762 length:381 start_codon:yes stop_codon:yes gene_type:complete